MKTIFYTYGLPGSGKDTWARQLQAEHPGAYIRVNKDDLRTMLDLGKHSSKRERIVREVRDAIIRIALTHGKHVIVSDTNLHPMHAKRFKELAEEIGKTVVQRVDFSHISVEECIANDLKRARSVGSDVIKSMFHRFIRRKVNQHPAYAKQDTALPPAVIVDIDGTLALITDRNPYDGKKCSTDQVNQPVSNLLQRIIAKVPTDTHPISVLLVSGRSEDARTATIEWLDKHGVYYSELFMRPSGDFRKDAIIKEEIYTRSIQNKYNILAVLDDRNQTVEMWRGLGLFCLQVADGDF